MDCCITSELLNVKVEYTSILQAGSYSPHAHVQVIGRVLTKIRSYVTKIRSWLERNCCNSLQQWGSIHEFTYLPMASPKMQEKSHIPAHKTVSVVCQVQNACPGRVLPSEIDSGCS